MASQGITGYVLVSIGIAALGSMQFGLHLAELNAPQDVITCHKKSISAVGGEHQDCIPMDEAAFAFISSVLTVGGLLGALAGGPLSSRRGRLFAMRLTSALYLAGSLMETASRGVPALALGRFLSGVGAGASTVIVPLYISELCPAHARGFFGFATQTSINLGILLAQTLGYFLSHGGAWRLILGVSACVAALHGAALSLVPETPAWLAAHGRVAQARSVLQRIRGRDADVRDEAARIWGRRGSGEEDGLLAHDGGAPPPPQQTKREPVHLGFLQVVRDPRTRPVIIALVGIMFVQQLCGINSVILYSVSLLADLLPVSSAFLSIIVSVANLLTTIACAPLPDRLGRKTCLLVSVVGQGTSALALALSIIGGHKVVSALAVLSFVAFFGVGLGPVPFILASELVSQDAVGATQSWCLGANYVATFLVAQFFPIVNKALNERLGGAGWVYLIFAALAALSAVFISWSFRSLRFPSATQQHP